MKIIIIKILLLLFNSFNSKIGDWGLGIGVWGFGVGGDWG